MNDPKGTKQPGQIVYEAHTPGYVWEQLAQKSKETRIRVEIRCPACSGEIQLINNTLLQCRACQTPIEIFQQRNPRTQTEIRFVYMPPTGPQIKRIRIRMQCLSCEKNITKAGDCTFSCGMQTYLIFAHEDGEFYVKRWTNKVGGPRDLPEIPLRQRQKIQQRNVITSSHPPTLREQILALMHTDPHIDHGEKGTKHFIYAIDANASAIKKELTKCVEDGRLEKVRYGYYRLPKTTCVKTDARKPQEAVESSQSSQTSIENHETHGVFQPLNQPNTTHTPLPDPSNAHIDVAGQILEYLSEHGGTGTTKQMRDAIGCSPQGFKDAIDKLIAEGQIQRIKRGTYKLTNQTQSSTKGILSWLQTTTQI